MSYKENGTAIEKVYDRYKSGLFNFCSRMLNNRDDAEDVVQEVFVKLFQGAAEFDGEPSLKVWLYKSARNRCLNTIRDKSRISNLGVDANEYPDPSPDIGGAEAKDSSAQTQRLFESLPVDYRDVLIMREMDGLSYAEIAEVLGTSLSAVKSRLFKARKKAIEVYRKLYGE